MPDIGWELTNEEIFDNPPEQTVAVVWYLVHLLGGEVSFPMDAAFWDNGPTAGDNWLTLHREDDKVVLRANTRSTS